MADSGDRKGSVQSLAKGLRLLEAIAKVGRAPTLSEAAAASGLDPGTCHRMLNTLVTEGYLARTDGRRFALTLKVLDLGFNAIASRDLRSLVRPILRLLVDEASEAASFAVLRGREVLYVERVRAGLTRLGVDIRVGTTVPVATSVIGLCLLAFRRGSLADFEGVDASLLEGIRADGYYLADSFYGNGLRVLAAPVLDSDKQAVAAISVAAPTIRASAADLKARALRPLLDATQRLAQSLEASGAALADGGQP
jgi:IclR family pca regulon transcriptional regulator